MNTITNNDDASTTRVTDPSIASNRSLKSSILYSSINHPKMSAHLAKSLVCLAFQYSPV